MRTTTLSLLFVLIYAGHAVAQQTYFVKGNARTLDPVIVEEEGYDQYYRVRQQTSNSILSYSPAEVSEFQLLNGDKYVAHTRNNGEQVFLRYLEEGTLGLLILIDTLYEEILFLEASNGIAEMSKDTTSDLYFRRVLDGNWLNCPENNSIISETYYQQGSMRRAIRAHNKCRKIAASRKQISFAGGLAHSKIKPDPGNDASSVIINTGINNATWNASNSFWLETQVELPIFKSYAFFVTGLRLWHMKFEGSTFVSFQEPQDYKYEMELVLLDISVPVGIQYTHHFNRVMPFIGAGVTGHYFISNTYDIHETRSNPPSQSFYSEKITSPGIGYYANLGVKVKVKENMAFQLKTGLNARRTVSEDRQYKFNSTTVLVGVSMDL